MPPPGGGAGRVVLFLPGQFKPAGRNWFKPASFKWQKLAETQNGHILQEMYFLIHQIKVYYF